MYVVTKIYNTHRHGCLESKFQGGGGENIYDQKSHSIRRYIFYELRVHMSFGKASAPTSLISGAKKKS